MPSMVFAAFAIVALLWPSPTLAASVTNRDHKVYMVTIIEGEAKQDHVLKPSLVLEGVCQKGCVIRFTDSENDEYKLDGSELVSIEDGVLYYDGPAADAASGVGDAGQLGNDGLSKVFVFPPDGGQHPAHGKGGVGLAPFANGLFAVGFFYFGINQVWY